MKTALAYSKILSNIFYSTAWAFWALMPVGPWLLTWLLHVHVEYNETPRPSSFFLLPRSIHSEREVEADTERTPSDWRNRVDGVPHIISHTKYNTDTLYRLRQVQILFLHHDWWPGGCERNAHASLTRTRFHFRLADILRLFSFCTLRLDKLHVVHRLKSLSPPFGGENSSSVLFYVHTSACSGRRFSNSELRSWI